MEEKIALQQQQLDSMPPEQAMPAEPDDGHEETVEEVKAKMAALQKGMDEGIKATDDRVQQMAQETADMPDFGALANLHGTISNMGKMRKRKQMNDLAAKLGVEVAAGDEDMPAEDLTNVMIQRAKEAGKSEEEINAALAE